jgi:glycosyltransferase involved in cell wall biosynthesis
MNDHPFRVLLFDTKYRNPNHYICLALYSALQRHPAVAFVAKADPLDAVAMAAKNGCNLFIAFDGEELDEVLCQRLATECGRSLLWVTEDPYELEVNLRHAKLFDLVFTNDSSSVAAYGANGRHLPLAGAPEFHSFEVQPAARPLRYDLFFAGTAWPNRSAFVRSILSETPGEWKFKLALPTNQFLPPHGVDLPESMLSWRTPPTEFARLVNRSAITLLLPRVFTASAGGREDAETPPPRLFEAALAGGVQMVHESLHEVARSFEPEKEIVLFSSIADFRTKAQRLIEDRAYRDSIAQAARERALAEHTYDRRVDTILTQARGIRRATPGVDASKPRTLMFVVHNVMKRGNFGGVEVYLERIRTKFGPDWKILFYLPGGGTRSREACVLSGDYTEIGHYRVNEGYGADMLSSPSQEQAFRRALLEHGVDLVHFHHFIGHVPSLVYVASELGVPSAYTAHDFFPVCHEFNLLSFKDEFCGAPDVSMSQCDVCMWQKHRIAPGSQARRRAFWDDVMRHCDLLVFNTESTRHIYAQMLPAVRQHERTMILPVPVPDGAARVKPRTPGKLKIAILGNVTRQKGGELIGRVLPILATAPVEFHVFGRIDLSHSRLGGAQKLSNVIVHGPYAADSLPDALKACDASLHLSIWPETYCLTLSEAWQEGLVPIVSDIGALGERVRHGVNGLKIAPESEGQLVDVVRRLIDEPELLDSLRANISAELYSTLSPHVDALRKTYASMLRTPQPAIAAGTEVRHLSLADMGIVLPSTKWHVGPNDGIGAKDSSVGQLIFTARRLAGVYRSRGLKQTVRLIANRVRSRI